MRWLNLRMFFLISLVVACQNVGDPGNLASPLEGEVIEDGHAILAEVRARRADLEGRHLAYDQAVIDLEAARRADDPSEVRRLEAELKQMESEILSLEASEWTSLGTPKPKVPKPERKEPLQAGPSAEAEASYLRLVEQYDMDNPDDVQKLEQIKREMLGR